MAAGEPTSSGDFLITEVQEDGHADIAAELQKAAEIKARFGENEEIRRKYDELRLATIGALRDLRIQTSQELDAVRQSLTGNINFSQLAEEGDISESEKGRIKDLSISLEALANGNELKKKDISELSQDEAHVMLYISYQEYGNYIEGGNASEILNMAGSFFSGAENNYENISDRREMNVFQETLLAKIYGNEIVSPGYTDTYIKTYGESQGGNAVISIVDFENNLKNTPTESWNSLGLIHYFKMLESNGNFNISTLLEKLGATQLIALRDFWKTNPNGPAMQYLQNTPELTWIIDGDIDYENMLQSRANFENLSLLFDVVDITEREKIREAIRYYFTDFISEGKDMSVVESIAGSENLGDVSEGMYRFIIEEARRTLIGQEFLDTMNVRYRAVPDIGDVLKAIMITILQERGVVDGELSFDFSGMNEMISTYNQENHSFLPLIGDETGETLKNLFSSGQILSQFSENKQQLNEVQNEIERLQNEIRLLENRLLSAEDERDVQSFNRQIEAKRNTLARYYNDRYRISRSVDINETNLQDVSSNLSENLVYNTSASSLSYILASPQTRISFITSPTQLLSLFQTHPDIFQSIHFRNINTFLMRNGDIVRQFPGKIDSNDINFIPETLLLEKEVLRKIRTADTSGRDTLLQEVLERITQGRTLTAEKLGEIYALLRELSHEQALYEYALPIILRNHHNETSEDKILLQEVEPSEAISLGEVQEIVSGLINGDEMYESHFGKINIFLQANGYSTEIEAQLKLLIDAKPEFYTGLWSVKGRNEFRNIHIFAVEKDINNFKHLSYFQIKESQYIEKVFEHINRGDGDIQEYLEILNLIPIENWDDVMKMIQLTEDYALLEKFQNVPMEKTRGFIDMIIQAYENSSESRKRLVHERPEELEIYQGIIGLRLSLESARVIGDNIDSIRENEKDFSETLSYIEGLPLTNEQKERLIEILEQSEGAEDFSMKFTVYILEIGAGDKEKIESIVEGMFEAVGADLAREKEELVSAPPTEAEAQDYPEWFQKSEGMTERLNEELLRRRFLDVTSRLSNEEIRSMSEAEIIEIFLKRYNIDPEHPFATRLRNILNIEAQQVKMQAGQRNVRRFIKAVENGTTDEFWANTRQQYYSGEISYIPVKPASSLSFQELTTQLSLTPLEYQTLSKDELLTLTQSKTARENFINFRQTLQDLNLESIWQFRNQIFTAIGSLDFNTRDQDYLGENEVNIFLSKVSYASLGKEKVPELKTPPQNIDETIRVIRRENNIGIFRGQEDVSAVGEGGGIIETLFRQKFAPKDAGIIDFKIDAFVQALKA